MNSWIHELINDFLENPPKKNLILFESKNCPYQSELAQLEAVACLNQGRKEHALFEMSAQEFLPAERSYEPALGPFSMRNIGERLISPKDGFSRIFQ